MAKKLNVTRVMSELSEGSAFFPGYKKQNSPTPRMDESVPAQEKSVESTQTITPVPPVRVVRDVPLVPHKKRVMKQRHPFDIYHDQYESLQKLALEERKQGGIGSMSAMVREAIDKFIEEKRNSLK